MRDADLADRLRELPLKPVAELLRAAAERDPALPGSIADFLELMRPNLGVASQMLITAVSEMRMGTDPLDSLNCIRDGLVMRLSGVTGLPPLQERLAALRPNPTDEKEVA